MKYLILIACCLVAACGLESRFLGRNLVPPPPLVADVCGAMYGQVQPLISAGTFDVEVDIENVGAGANDGYDYYAVCSGGSELKPSKASPPGTIEFTTGLTPTIYVRLNPSANIDFKSYAATGNLQGPVALIDGTGKKPAPGQWSNCVAPHVTPYNGSLPYHYIFFPLCAAGKAEKDYTYAIILRNSTAQKNDQLDPQIIHHPSMASATP